MKKNKTLLDKINIPKQMSEHLFGEKHNHAHHLTIGFIIAYIGTMIARSAHMIPYQSVGILVDLFGYGLHGIGAAPLVDYLQKQKIERMQKEEQDNLCTVDCEVKP